MNPTRWACEQEIAHRLLDDLAVGEDAQGRAFFVGTYTLRSEHGHVYGRFVLRVVYPRNFPKRRAHPCVYLESHRNIWQNFRDSHIESDWRLCLYVALESDIDFERDDSLCALFAAVHTFLIRERIYQRALAREALTGVPAIWPGPQRSHGVAGLREAMQERGRPGRNDPCVCGSGVKFKKCCLTRVS